MASCMHTSFLPYGNPYPVSPLIRGARYVFLVAGIIYGITKQRYYVRKEEQWREEEAKRKIIRDRENAIMRAKIAAEERENVKLLETGKLFDPPEYEFEKPKKRCDCEDED
ncbi:unnamed protein product [Chrysodeixis includens]|uniref:ATP synthase F(0) complex subunit e, mitochondrial n=1 Tax=Chrysodeixis includens TaxID=689277 RepID=A0A9P0C1P6_CHRIL|nr:unnamed protein product [Chrysodeixis includens]